MQRYKTILLATMTAVAICLASCQDTEENLKHRALELCRYIPNYGLTAEAQNYMTADFYDLLDEAYKIPSFTPLDYEMLFYFTTEKWREEPDYEITKVTVSDATHAIATINAKQKIWNDEDLHDYYIDYEGDEHTIAIEKVGGVWFMADFDDKKAEFAEYVAQCRKEQSWVTAIEQYLTDSIAPHYAPAEYSVPLAVIIAFNADDSTDMMLWGDYWVFNGDLRGDTLFTVSGGNHPGCFHLKQNDTSVTVELFDQAEDGAGNKQSLERIFEDALIDYQMRKEEDNYLENHCREAIDKFAKKHGLTINYYKDYGWPAVKIAL